MWPAAPTAPAVPFAFGLPTTPAAAPAAAPPAFGIPAAPAAPLFSTGTPAAAVAAIPRPAFSAAPTAPLFGIQPYTPFSLVPPQQQQQQHQQLQQPGERTPQQALFDLFEFYNPSCPKYRFRYMFYNRIPPGKAQLFVKPANVDDQLWALAVRDNPEPTRLTPVQALGFQDLQKRVAEQAKQTEQHARQVREAEAFVEACRRKHTQIVESQLPALRRTHAALAHRVLCLMQRLEVVRRRGQPMSPDEEGLFARLDKLSARLESPTAFRGRVAELVTAARALEDRPRPPQALVVQPQQLEPIASYLTQQQEGLNSIVDLLKQAQRDIAAISADLSRPR